MGAQVCLFFLLSLKRIIIWVYVLFVAFADVLF